MNKIGVEDFDVRGKKVLLRVDFNVPLSEDLKVTDNTRILAALPTIKYLIEQGGRVILLSHLGRPKGKPSEKFSLKPVSEELSRVLEKNISYCPSILGPVAQSAIDCLKDGDCLLMENIRFYVEEEKCDHQFSKELATMVDKYVNDAFGTAHRKHASTAGVAQYFDDAACGYLMKKELDYLGNLVKEPQHPFCAIIGGAKVKDKIKVISRLMDIADDILIGGGMAYTFLKVQNHQIGNSILDDEHIEVVKKTLKKAEDQKKGLYLPTDHIVAKEFKNDVEYKTVGIDIPDGYMGLDIGPETVKRFSNVINGAKTIFWNGPMGVFEMSNFQKGTFEIAKVMAESKGTTVVGGGDSVSAVNKIDKASQMSHVSTGGGASLEFLEGKSLPGVEVLAEKK